MANNYIDVDCLIENCLNCNKLLVGGKLKQTFVMKEHLKKILLMLLILLRTVSLFAQPNPQKQSINIDSLKIIIQQAIKSNSQDPAIQTQIADLNKQIISLTQTVASTKESFYNSNIYLWTFIITALGLIIVIAGYFGYRSISDKIAEIKIENEGSTEKSETAVKEIKSDLIQRIIELKGDIKDFKEDQQRKFEKFEKEANDKIDKGLDLALQKAIEKVMKGSYAKVIDDLNAQVAELRIKVDNLTPANPAGQTQKPTPEENKFDNTGTAEVKPTNNAFDE